MSDFVDWMSDASAVAPNSWHFPQEDPFILKSCIREVLANLGIAL